MNRERIERLLEENNEALGIVADQVAEAADKSNHWASRAKDRMFKYLRINSARDKLLAMLAEHDRSDRDTVSANNRKKSCER